MNGQSLSDKVVKLLFRIALILLALIIIYPLVWIVLASFKTNRELYANPWAIPQTFNFKNYTTAWVKSRFSLYFLNSILVVTISTIFNTVISMAFGYVIAKYKGMWVSAMNAVFVFSMMIPGVMILMPQYFRANSLGMTNNLLFLCVIYVIGSIPFNSFILSRFAGGIHDAILEAAVIDGANEFQIFSNIIIPLTKSGISIVLVLNIIGYWNEYLTALTFLADEKKFTVPIGISNLNAVMQYRTDYGALFAGLIIGMIPVLIFYGIFQRQLQEGVAGSSGVKG